MGYRPYCDATLYPTFDLTSVPKVDHFILGFVVSGADHEPSWGGYYPTSSSYFDKRIEELQKKNGDITVSFGGAEGRELATVCGSSLELFSKYSQVIKKYDLASIDFDIEGPALNNDMVNQRRGLAIQEIKRVFPGIKVSITVPVSPNGLDPHVLKMLDYTPCDLLNIMAMDFGSGQGKMLQYTVSAAKAARKQTNKNIGITVMIGHNDISGEVFTLDDARELKKFVSKNSWVKQTSIWSINRDNGDKISLPHSSMVDQFKFQYSAILK